MTYKFYDTSALINNIDKLFDDPDDFIFISSISIEELEHLKATNRANANHVLNILEKHDEEYCSVLYKEKMARPIKKYGAELTNDLKIIACAISLYNIIDDFIFISDDIAQRAYADMFLKDVRKSHYQVPQEIKYSGYKEIIMTDGEMADFYADLSKNNYNLLTNEYIIIYNEKNEYVDTYYWNGYKHKPISYPDVTSMYFGTIKPYKDDIYQRLALDSFNRNSITMIAGKPGSGKTYLALSYLFSQLEKGMIDRIIVFSNPVVAKNAAKLGFYPGTVDEKLLSSSVGGILSSKIGSLIEVERLIQNEKLILIPAGDARGYETPARSGVYIMESQNLTSDLLRMLLQRISEDCKVIVDGDYLEQVDMDVYADDNGMKKMSEVFRGSDLYGQVELQQIHRSKIALLADKMRS